MRINSVETGWDFQLVECNQGDVYELHRMDEVKFKQVFGRTYLSLVEGQDNALSANVVYRLTDVNGSQIFNGVITVQVMVSSAFLLGIAANHIELRQLRYLSWQIITDTTTYYSPDARTKYLQPY